MRAFQLPSYTEHFRCIAVDLPGSGESDEPAGPYSTERYADQVAAFLGAIGLERAHVAGMSLGAAGGHPPGRPPSRPRELALRAQRVARQRRLPEDRRGTVAHARVDAADHRRGDPGRLPVASRPRCMSNGRSSSTPGGLCTRPPRSASGSVPRPDRSGRPRRERGAGRGRCSDPDHFGARDLVCSTRFAAPLKNGIPGASSSSSTRLSHAGLHEDPETFNRATLEFLFRNRE
jgi:pimeloyl-ACP methyl ester carboxylesterase